MPRRKKHRGGKVKRFEPQNTMDLNSSPMIITCFQNVGCFQFCERVQQVQSHPKLTMLFILNLHEKQSNFVGMTFEIFSNSIAHATEIPNVGEKWFKRENLDICCYETFLKPRYKEGCKTIFHFSHLVDRHAPLMRVIMK